MSLSLEKELDKISALSKTEQQLALAGLIAELFAKEGVELTVVGGAAVQYYTDGEYTTSDVDAILWFDTKDIIESVMSSIGFRRTTSYRHFEHDRFPFVVEFPPSPIEVGGRDIYLVNTLMVGGRPVQVIKVEDIIMDRIIAGVEWKSSIHLDQARLLWLKNKSDINRPYLTDFAKKEGYLKTLKAITTPAKTPKNRRKAVKTP